MNIFTFGSINKTLALLIVLAVSPALAILLYSGIDERQHSIESAKRDILLLTHNMAIAQKEITHSTEQILTTLSLVSSIQDMEIPASSEILEAVLKQNPQYNNIALVNPKGEVLAAGKNFTQTNLADRKHVREALKTKKFAVGEYIISRLGSTVPAFAFACPVLDKDGAIKGLLTTVAKLNKFERLYDLSVLPDKSFIAVTDHHGIRLFYYPAQEKTNPVGSLINAKNWQIAQKATDPGSFTSTGNDGILRMFAFEQVRLTPEEAPYMYVWAGIPEAQITASADANLSRNLLLMLFATIFSLCISWFFGKKYLISPIQNLVVLTQNFTQGTLETRGKAMPKTKELVLLTNAFYEMAENLTLNQRALRENESRFRLLMDSLNAYIFVADMETYEVLFINEYAKKQFGDITGQKCWQSIQNSQDGPCTFCTNKYLLTEEGNPAAPHCWEFQNTVIGKWLFMNDRSIEWVDGRLVRLQVATDFTDKKKNEDEREQLITQLQEALAKIKTLSGFLPICASCKMIRDDQGYWNEIEAYIRDHSEADFSHSICPDCAKKLYPELYP
jgi:hypothetical protein